ncbi:TorD/DmsD family molecular chaperone [Slackia piriformis]|uniref:TorD/DmsD family molecular chaperone n=1 Tax=Slackia piriformis TaxID=626934 RepID=UPI0032C15558
MFTLGRKKEVAVFAPEDYCMFAQSMEARAAVYGLLARLYRAEIDEELLEELHARRYPVHSGDKSTDEGYYRIAKYLSNRWDNTLTELAIDYVRCFVGHGNDAYAAAYPFESVYMSPKRLLMQPARDEVLAIYRSVGLEKRDDWTEGEDHISVELEFLQILCQRAARAFENGDEAAALNLLQVQKNFIEDHLAKWVPLFLKDVKRLSKTDFYSGLASLSNGFLRQDHAMLKEVLSDVR